MMRFKKSPANEYGEVKKPFTFMLTPTATALIDEIADIHNVSRSEILEMMLRGGGLKVVAAVVAKKAKAEAKKKKGNI